MNYNKLLHKMTKEKDDVGCGALLLACLFILALVFGFDCLIVWVCMLLWNACLVPVLAGTAVAVGTIKFWPMFGLYLLFGFLFRSHNTSYSSKND